MNPLVQSRQTSAEEGEAPSSPAHSSPAHSARNAAVRVDGPHLTPLVGTQAPAEAIEPEPVSAPSQTSDSGYVQGVDHLLLQANQIADHLRQQCVELDRR